MLAKHLVLLSFTYIYLSLAFVDLPAASGTSHNAAPAFVQLRIMGADVVPYIPQSKERLTAELHSKEGQPKVLTAKKITEEDN